MRRWIRDRAVEAPTEPRPIKAIVAILLILLFLCGSCVRNAV